MYKVYFHYSWKALDGTVNNMPIIIINNDGDAEFEEYEGMYDISLLESIEARYNIEFRFPSSIFVNSNINLHNNNLFGLIYGDKYTISLAEGYDYYTIDLFNRDCLSKVDRDTGLKIIADAKSICNILNSEEPVAA